jgi:hypothetical protein
MYPKQEQSNSTDQRASFWSVLQRTAALADPEHPVRLPELVETTAESPTTVPGDQRMVASDFQRPGEVYAHIRGLLADVEGSPSRPGREDDPRDVARGWLMGQPIADTMATPTVPAQTPSSDALIEPGSVVPGGMAVAPADSILPQDADVPPDIAVPHQATESSATVASDETTAPDKVVASDEAGTQPLIETRSTEVWPLGMEAMGVAWVSGVGVTPDDEARTSSAQPVERTEASTTAEAGAPLATGAYDPNGEARADVAQAQGHLDPMPPRFEFGSHAAIIPGTEEFMNSLARKNRAFEHTGEIDTDLDRAADKLGWDRSDDDLVVKRKIFKKKK